jgi:glucokinase
MPLPSTLEKPAPATRDARKQALVIGVDIGGTKVAAGLVDPATGKILTHAKFPMKASGAAAQGLASVTSAIDQVLSSPLARKSALGGIGLCAPGPLDPLLGRILNPPNVPCWRDFDLADEIAKKYHLPVKVDNDANAAALAETLWGAGLGYRSVFYVTIGTGIGTGIILNERIYHGRTGLAAEGGHLSIDHRGPFCNCGKRGCIEVLAAGPAIAREARARLAANPILQSTILDLADGNLEAITTEMVGEAYASGDALAVEVLQYTVDLLSFWLGNIIDLLEPEIIIVGGGVAPILQPFFDDIRKLLRSYCVNPRGAEIPIVSSHYGADAGIAGGAALCSGSTFQK